jgi:short-subunit dehydrogenase
MFTLITGASSGIGYELAHIFAREKYNLVLIARSQDKLLELKRELEKTYAITVFILVVDLTQLDAADQIFIQVENLKITIDILVNNAGFGLFGEFITTDWQREEEMIRVNIISLTRLTKLFVPQMKQNKKGKILNIASTAAFFPGPLMAVYYATKAYVLSFSQALQSELEGTGVTVTTLCPGPTVSHFQKTAVAEGVRTFAGKLPTAQEVAEVGFAALMKGKSVAIQGVKNKLLIWFSRFLPRKVIAAQVKKIQQIR